jgi:hypothetical protein
MSRLDFPASAEALWDIYDAGGPRPEYLIPVLARESGLWPFATNGYTHGLNQVSTKWLTKRGIAVADYLHKWLPSQQLSRIVKGYMMMHVAQFGAINSGVRCYLMNFLPAFVRDGKTELSQVIAVRGAKGNSGKYYSGNSGLDVDHKGTITVGDLAFVIYNMVRGKEYGAIVQDAIAQTYEARPMEKLHDPVYGDDYPLPYLTGSYGDVAAGVSEMLAKGLTRLTTGKKP